MYTRSRYGNRSRTAYRGSDTKFTAGMALEQGGVRVQFTYNPTAVEELKEIVPYKDRRYEPATKTWMISPSYAVQVAAMLSNYTEKPIKSPVATSSTSATGQRLVQRVLDVKYIGSAQKRQDGMSTAYSCVSVDDWSVVFPEDVLRAWFSQPATPEREPGPASAATLYEVLLLSQTANNVEVKSAYRRLARQWHPDVCKEPDATEQFRAIQHAYAILVDSMMRRKYDVGLKLQALAPEASKKPVVPASAEIVGNKVKINFGSGQDTKYGYRSPLRNGRITVEGEESLGRFFVSKILSWEDLTDTSGRTFVSWWSNEAKTFQSTWEECNI